ncbi:MAG TPA: hypothetical protein EYQ74_13020 [Planctomycetes bacterium]|nr:hypothetical protein [Planctomycetota bacterium]HIK60593.1 hypothetical protein [Planctomycetota bacterium]
MTPSKDSASDRANITKVPRVREAAADPRPELEASAELEASLARVFEGLEIVDRDLQLGGKLVVDLVGLDGAGRTILALIVNGDEDSLALQALDTLAWVNTYQDAWASYLGQGGQSSGEDPLVVFIADKFETRQVERMGPLIPASIALLQRCRLESERSSGMYLQAIVAETPEVEDTREKFLTSLAETPRQWARDLVLRFNRMDEEVECRASGEVLGWRYRGLPLCSVRPAEGGLEAQICGSDSEFTITEEGHLEAFVDEVQKFYLEAFEQAGADDPDLPRVELQPTGPQPHLSAEELKAFR